MPKEKFSEAVTIQFEKVGTTPKDFSVEEQGLAMEGTLRRTGAHLVELEARIDGKISLDCDRCGQPYYGDFEENINLILADEIVQDKANLDIIEFLDGRIDLLYILQSESNAVAGDYHFCPACEAESDALEIEY